LGCVFGGLIGILPLMFSVLDTAGTEPSSPSQSRTQKQIQTAPNGLPKGVSGIGIQMFYLFFYFMVLGFLLGCTARV